MPIPRKNSEHSRRAILEAAAAEFSSQGIAGARIDTIAAAARVNKALLYYYFQDKETLYGAALQHTFGGLLEELVRILDTDRPVGYKILAYALTHFNYVAAHQHYRRMVQHEMMRAGTGQSRHFENLVETFFRPLLRRLSEVLESGISTGEFRRMDPLQFVQSMIATVVFYFTSVPVVRAVGGFDPLSREALDRRRKAMLEFLAGALFVNHAHAERVVQEVLENISDGETSSKLEAPKPHDRSSRRSTEMRKRKEVR
ncbi:MAG: TetR/AcrR family transcriptional regulator [Terriglobia bacterium]|jgi:TetR/AcrR family transcriptional regulator|nr:TetR/AcrR family transcriptional regulator [Terriglobia bacterium]